MVANSKHLQYINRCIYLAKKGGKHVKTNPQVGALLVYEDRIIGESYHKKFGESHAEVNAINNVKKNERIYIPDSTLYVSLEPCNIESKTPPCTSLIINHNIKKVVVGTSDPNPLVNNKGINLLRAHGIEVTELNDPACLALIRPFRHLLSSDLPYVILKFAQSSDFYMGAKDEQVWISNEASKIRSHQWRTEVDGILVGSNTVVIDNPALTARLYPGESPMRIVLDRSQRVNESHLMVSDDEEVKIVDSQKPLGEILKGLRREGINILMVEGGRKVLDSFIKENLWQEARIITASKRLTQGIKSPKVSGILLHTERFAEDKIETIINE